MINKLVYAIALALLLTTTISAQDNSSYGYKGAINEYLINQKDLMPEDMLDKAVEANQTGDLQKADFWYTAYLKSNPTDTDAYEPYVEILQELGNCAAANRISRQFLGDSSLVCEVTTTKMGNVEYDKIKKINSRFLEFAVLPVGEDEIVFTSNRKPRKKGPKDGKTGDYFAKMFRASFTEDFNVDGYEPIYGDFENDSHTGTPSFFNDGKTMIFTQNNSLFLNEKLDNPLHLYYATLEGEKWTAFEPLNINMDKYTSCHSTLNKENDIIIFASDRPGGFGKMDLYMSYKEDGKNWSDPVNLGPSINTSENEIFPTIVDETLYFSTDGHGDKSVSKLDIVSAYHPNPETPFLWLNVERLPEPFNSEKDDVSFTAYTDMKKGFFASNRKGKGDDDIYYWTTETPINESLEDLKSTFNVLEPELASTLGNQNKAVVTLDGKSKKVLESTINTQGEIEINYDPKIYHTATIEKEGFDPLEVPLTKNGKVSDKIVYGKMEANASKNFDYVSRIIANLDDLKEFSVELIDEKTNETFPLEMDSKGAIVYDAYKLDRDYKFKVYKKGVVVAEELMNKTKSRSFLQNNVVYQDFLYRESFDPIASAVNTVVEVIDAEEVEHIEEYDEVVEVVEEPTVINTTSSIPVEAPIASETINSTYVERVAKMETLVIYYDTNEYQLDSQNAALLDKFFDKFGAYKEDYILEIDGHTDNVGSAAYNQALSERRARKVAEFFKGKGISTLNTYEFGESKTIHYDNKNLNRRVEIKLIPKG